MRFFFIEVSFIIFMFTSTLAEISNLFTDWDFPSSDAQSALDEPNPGPSLSAADSINNDMFAFSDAFEVLADSTSQCSSSSTYSSRRRDTTCGAEEDPDEFSDDSLLTYRDMALLNAKEQLSKLDEKQCPEDAFPYFICSSKNPDDTEWVTSLISFICRNSARVGDTNQIADCQEPSHLFCCGTWERNIDDSQAIPMFGVLGTGLVCTTWPS